MMCPSLAIAGNDGSTIGPETTTDSITVVSKLDKFKSLYSTDSLTAFQHLEDARLLIEKNQNNGLLGEWFFQKALYFEHHYQLDSAVKYYTIAEENFKKARLEERVVSCMVNRMLAYYDINKYAECISLGHELLQSQKVKNDSAGIALALKLIGVAYDYVDEHETAIEYYENALAIYIKLEDKDREGGIYHNLAGIYNDEGQIDKSISNYNKAIEIATILKDSTWIATLYVNFGLVYLKSDNTKAKDLFTKGLNIALSTGSKSTQGFAYQNLASVHVSLEKYALAEKYALKCLELGEYLSIHQLVENSHDRLYKIYYKTGKYKKAIEHLKTSQQISDSIYTQNNASLLKEMQAKYESEKKGSENDLLRKEAEIQESKLRRRNTAISLLIILFVFLLIGSAVFYRANYVRKQLLDKIRKQKEGAERDREIIEHQTEKLKEHDIMKSRFFANVSHDFRTPLTLIMGSLDNIKHDTDSQLTYSSLQDLNMGEKNCNKLLFLANEINELNRLDEGSLRLKLKNLNAAEFIKLITDMFSSAADAQLISLYYESTLGRDQIIAADPNHFERIIYNLLTNALKFTPKGGRITVKVQMDTSEGSNMLIVKISDTGKGISKNSLPYVFNRFYQSIKNDYSTREGFGIGLALVKELVTLHSGKISVSSKERVGTTFTLTFPVVTHTSESETVAPEFSYDPDMIVVDTQEASKEQIEATSPSIFSDKVDQTVLIVEDHKEIAEYIDSIISRKYNTLIAPNGKAALEILKNNKVSLVVTDLMMPWMDGFELVQAIKDNEQLENLPIVVVSARTSQEDKNRVLELGVNDFLIKPFKAEELLLRINNLIKNNEQGNEDLGSLFINNEGQLKEFEKDLVKKLEDLVVKNISNSRFSVVQLADEMAASERQIYRMIKKLSGKTPYEYIKEVRWQYIEYMLKNKKISTIAEAARSIGMSNVTDFKKQFNKRFNKLPSEYIS